MKAISYHFLSKSKTRRLELTNQMNVLEDIAEETGQDIEKLKIFYRSIVWGVNEIAKEQDTLAIHLSAFFGTLYFNCRSAKYSILNPTVDSESVREAARVLQNKIDLVDSVFEDKNNIHWKKPSLASGWLKKGMNHRQLEEHQNTAYNAKTKLD